MRSTGQRVTEADCACGGGPVRFRGPEWTRLPVARLHYTKTTRLWTPYRCDQQHAKSHRYRFLEPRPNLQDLLDRDVTSAMLAACVQLTDPDDAPTARIDHRFARVLRAWLASQQE